MLGIRQAILRDLQLQPDLPLMWPSPTKEDFWGVMAPIKDTPWGQQIPLVPGEIWSLALHGHTKPLRQLLGPPPVVRARRLPLADRVCAEPDCAIRTSLCVPGSGKLPRCYRPPGRDVHPLVRTIACAWDEGRYIVVVQGPEFVI